MAEGNIVSVESVSNGKLIEEYVTKALDLIILKGVKDLGEELGTGTFGYVRKVEWQGLPCAAKVFNQDRMEECTTARYEKKSFDREVYLWALCLRHKNIVQMYGLWEHASGTGIVMELLATNLASFLKKSRTRIHSITLDVKRGILLDICCGMRYLHGMNVMHRSLSSSNVLLTSNFVAKISDFSTARVYENFDEGKASNFSKYLRLKKSFVAPEMFSQNHGLKSDIFSFGCIIIHSLTHEDPKPCVGSTEFDKRAYLLNNIVDDVVIEFKPLIQRCLAAPELRPSFLDLYVQISRHPHVEDEDRMNLTFSQIDELHSCHIPKTRRNLQDQTTNAPSSAPVSEQVHDEGINEEKTDSEKPQCEAENVNSSTSTSEVPIHIQRMNLIVSSYALSLTLLYFLKDNYRLIIPFILAVIIPFLFGLLY